MTRRLAKSINTSARKKLTAAATEVRRDVLTMIQHAKSGNPGSALSCVEILTWLLRHEMDIDVNNPKWEQRDRLVLSKGHSAPVFYSLGCQLGWVKRDELLGFRCFKSRLQTHPEYTAMPCIDYTSGSLGQGLSAAGGMALAARYQKNETSRFFVLLGDGEIQEGQVWEAAMTIGHYGLSNVTAIIDRNTFQGDRAIDEQKDLEPLADKWRAFKWNVVTCDGHDYLELESALRELEAGEKPGIIIANTVKGKGVSYMENNNSWHVGGPKFTDERLSAALNELRN